MCRHLVLLICLTLRIAAAQSPEELSPAAVAERDRAVALARTGDFEKALHAADALVSLAPESPEGYFIRAGILSFLAGAGTAEQLRQKPDDFSFKGAQQRFEGAAADLTRFLARSKNVSLCARAAVAVTQFETLAALAAELQVAADARRAETARAEQRRKEQLQREEAEAREAARLRQVARDDHAARTRRQGYIFAGFGAVLGAGGAVTMHISSQYEAAIVDGGLLTARAIEQRLENARGFRLTGYTLIGGAGLFMLIAAPMVFTTASEEELPIALSVSPNGAVVFARGRLP